MTQSSAASMIFSSWMVQESYLAAEMLMSELDLMFWGHAGMPDSRI
jgi:hypothetical protein